MSERIIEMRRWLASPPGRYLLAWEQAEFDRLVVDLFGYHALQLGLPEIDALRANRMPHRWVAAAGVDQGPLAPVPPPSPVDRLDGPNSDFLAPPTVVPSLAADFSQLPFESSSLDLIVLPHALELHADPHSTLREVERVLMPEGRVIITCLNPTSLWGLRQRRGRLWRRVGLGHKLFLPDAGEFLGPRRLRDWLRLLSFEVEDAGFGCWRPALTTERWLDRFEWMDRAGERWWPILGAAYFVVAVKRVHGARLIGRVWKPAAARAKVAVPAVNRMRHRDAPSELEQENV